MNFFKSVFTDPPEEQDPQQKQPTTSDPDPDPDPDPNPTTWTFGSLIETLATKSESVIQTYRRDLEELSSGLKKETSMIRDAASRAATTFPDSLEAGASVAQESLESVGQAIDDIGATVWKFKDVILAPDYDNDTDELNCSDGVEFKKYSRFDAQLQSVESDARTYCEDLDGYREWRESNGVVLDEEEVEDLLRGNDVVRSFYQEFVDSGMVDRESFWGRYFYRVFKLRETEKARAEIVRRAISGEDEEDLSWDVDDDESNEQGKENVSGGERVEGKVVDNSDSCKDSDVSVVSSQPSMPEVEELGWDKIEDVGYDMENKEEAIAKSSREELRKRLTEAEEEEDLSWDIEDDDSDDQPTKL